jgi:hypothetical protein
LGNISENSRKFNKKINTWVFPLKNGGMLQRPYGMFEKKIFFYNFLLLTTKNVGSKNWDDSDNSSEVTEVLS